MCCSLSQFVACVAVLFVLSGIRVDSQDFFIYVYCVLFFSSLLQCIVVRCNVMPYVAVGFSVGYGVATVSRIDEITGLFCRISSLL